VRQPDCGKREHLSEIAVLMVKIKSNIVKKAEKFITDQTK
jgi:hypothetical protein